MGRKILLALAILLNIFWVLSIASYVVADRVTTPFVPGSLQDDSYSGCYYDFSVVCKGLPGWESAFIELHTIPLLLVIGTMGLLETPFFLHMDGLLALHLFEMIPILIAVGIGWYIFLFSIFYPFRFFAAQRRIREA